jgi:hypothetical protein
MENTFHRSNRSTFPSRWGKRHLGCVAIAGPRLPFPHCRGADTNWKARGHACSAVRITRTGRRPF